MVNGDIAMVDFKIYGSRKSRRGVAFWLVCHRYHRFARNSLNRMKDWSLYELDKIYAIYGNGLKTGSPPCF